MTSELAPPLISFTPVPRQRRTRNGWTEERQRGFIAALAECGSVSRAARSVGMSPRSAYRLMDADGADSFAAAWEVSRTGLPGAVRTRRCDRLHFAHARVEVRPLRLLDFARDRQFHQLPLGKSA